MLPAREYDDDAAAARCADDELQKEKHLLRIMTSLECYLTIDDVTEILKTNFVVVGVEIMGSGLVKVPGGNFVAARGCDLVAAGRCVVV